MNSRQREVSVAMEMHSRNSQPAALVQVLYTCMCMCTCIFTCLQRRAWGQGYEKPTHTLYVCTIRVVCICIHSDM